MMQIMREHLDGSFRKFTMVPKRRDWRSFVKGLLKVELKRHDPQYAGVAERVAAIGVEASERNISKKNSRRSFTALFFVLRMEAIGCHAIHLSGD
jgi:Domain of unknown function (DUF6471)